MKDSHVVCARCRVEVVPLYEQPRLRKYARLYFLLPIPFVPFLPIISSDYFVMIPLTMLYLLGVGPALSWLTQKPVCPECDAFVTARPSRAPAMRDIGAPRLDERPE